MFSTDSPKAIKADKYGYLNAILYMAPHNISGVNLCPKASPACAALCLGWFSGQASMVTDLEHGRNNVREARVRKAKWFMSDRQAFMRAIHHKLIRLQGKAFRKGKTLCVRMNGSTDIAWEGIRYSVIDDGPVLNLFDHFPDVQFVDYTKIASRFDRALPSNYHLTFSRSETNEREAMELLDRGVNVAVVFESKPRYSWHGYPVVDGDEHDLRHLDPRGGYVIALSPKGHKIKRDTSGFVVRDAYMHDTKTERKAA